MSRDARALLATAVAAAEDAARVVMRGYRSRPTVGKKGRIDLVTEFDQASEALLRERLTRETPYAFHGEETGAVGTGDVIWYVDPLDGTTNFVHGHPFFCVSVGLFAEGAPVLGAIVAPALGVTWTGLAQGGAWRNGVACAVSEASSLDDALLATGFPYDRATSPDNNLAEFVALELRCHGVRRCGAAALDLCLVADGTYDGYWERKLNPWDLCAGAAIILGAGGRLSGLDGAPADVRSGSLMATNGLLHDALVHALAAAPRLASARTSP